VTFINDKVTVENPSEFCIVIAYLF